jgi:hypothetical protein
MIGQSNRQTAPQSVNVCFQYFMYAQSASDASVCRNFEPLGYNPRYKRSRPRRIKISQCELRQIASVFCIPDYCAVALSGLLGAMAKKNTNIMPWLFSLAARSRGRPTEPKAELGSRDGGVENSLAKIPSAVLPERAPLVSLST